MARCNLLLVLLLYCLYSIYCNLYIVDCRYYIFRQINQLDHIGLLSRTDVFKFSSESSSKEFSEFSRVAYMES